MGVLLLLMTIGGVIVAAILLGIAWLHESAWLRKFVVGATAIWFGFYFVTLLGVSLLSKEKTIDVGDKDGKAFCGFYLDCHMHTAVTSVVRTKTIGNKTANGEFYIVRVKVFSNAKQATLSLHDVDAHVADALGNTYARDIDAERQLAPQPEFDQEISPVESFEKQIVYDLPVKINSPRLDIRVGSSLERLIEAVLIGDEDSILHKRSYFSLEFGTRARLLARPH